MCVVPWLRIVLVLLDAWRMGRRVRFCSCRDRPFSLSSVCRVRFVGLRICLYFVFSRLWVFDHVCLRRVSRPCTECFGCGYDYVGGADPCCRHGGGDDLDYDYGFVCGFGRFYLSQGVLWCCLCCCLYCCFWFCLSCVRVLYLEVLLARQ